MSGPPELLLASTSPRRSALLSAAGIRFDLCEPGAEYEGASGEHEAEHGAPLELALGRARRKALGAGPRDRATPLLAVDTVVDLDGREVSKAADARAAEALLRSLLGRTHLVHTAHCLLVPSTGALLEEVATSSVACRTPTAEELGRYVRSEQWRGKAGAYGIQDPAQDFFALVAGSLDTVVGLHVAAVRRLLARAGGAS